MSDNDTEEQQAQDQADPEQNGNASNEAVPDFDEQPPTPSTGQANIELKRFGSVRVALSAQLGQTELTISEMMELTEGAVVELNREIGQPVELVAQGVPLGNGEVVVIDDRFAIRIKEIYQV